MCIPKDAYAAFDQKEHFCSVLWDGYLDVDYI
jgi:hypothetical protein